MLTVCLHRRGLHSRAPRAMPTSPRSWFRGPRSLPCSPYTSHASSPCGPFTSRAVPTPSHHGPVSSGEGPGGVPDPWSLVPGGGAGGVPVIGTLDVVLGVSRRRLILRVHVAMLLFGCVI